MTRMHESSLRNAVDAVVTLLFQRGGAAHQSSRGHKALEIRQLEEHFAHASDHHDFEQMERDWDRRDGGGMRVW
jgi:hypothetical protein